MTTYDPRAVTAEDVATLAEILGVIAARTLPAGSPGAEDAFRIGYRLRTGEVIGPEAMRRAMDERARGEAKPT